MKEMNLIWRLIDEAKKFATVEAVIMMGSYGDESCIPQIGSDYDVYILIAKDADSAALLHPIVDTICGDRLLLKLPLEHKLVAYLKDPFVKLDLAYGRTLDEYSRYLRGSEVCRVLYSRSESAKVELGSIMATKAVECLPEYKFQHHQDRFVEFFELLCKSIARKDEYRVEFYGFLLRNALVCMELIQSAGDTQHLYLPKQAFQRCQVGKKLPPVLESKMPNLYDKANQYAEYFLALLKESQQQGIDSYSEYFGTVMKAYF